MALQAGNEHYRVAEDLPDTVALFPLSAALLLPGGRKLAKLSYQAEADNALLLRQIIDGMPDADRLQRCVDGLGGSPPELTDLGSLPRPGGLPAEMAFSRYGR